MPSQPKPVQRSTPAVKKSPRPAKTTPRRQATPKRATPINSASSNTETGSALSSQQAQRIALGLRGSTPTSQSQTLSRGSSVRHVAASLQAPSTVTQSRKINDAIRENNKRPAVERQLYYEDSDTAIHDVEGQANKRRNTQHSRRLTGRTLTAIE